MAMLSHGNLVKAVVHNSTNTASMSKSAEMEMLFPRELNSQVDISVMIPVLNSISMLEAKLPEITMSVPVKTHADSKLT